MDLEATLLSLLAEAGATWEILDHAPIASAAEAAALRGTALEEGGKALVMKLDRIGFAVLALGGDRRVDGKALRRGFGIQRYRFARREELRDLTGLAPGAVPPFGRPVFDLPLFVDADLAAGARIAFTLGRPDRSVLLDTAAWLRAARPEEILPLAT